MGVNCCLPRKGWWTLWHGAVNAIALGVPSPASTSVICLPTGGGGGGGGKIASLWTHPPTQEPKNFTLGKNETLKREPKVRGPFRYINSFSSSCPSPPWGRPHLKRMTASHQCHVHSLSPAHMLNPSPVRHTTKSTRSHFYDAGRSNRHNNWHTSVWSSRVGPTDGSVSKEMVTMEQQRGCIT